MGTPVFVGIFLEAIVGLYMQIGLGRTWGYLADMLTGAALFSLSIIVFLATEGWCYSRYTV